MCVRLHQKEGHTKISMGWAVFNDIRIQLQLLQFTKLEKRNSDEKEKKEHRKEVQT